MFAATWRSSGAPNQLVVRAINMWPRCGQGFIAETMQSQIWKRQFLTVSKS